MWGGGSSTISKAVPGVAKVSSILGRDAHPSWEMVATKRLLLRTWRSADRRPFAAMNADPEVMEFFPRTLTRVESDQFMDRIEAGWELRGFGLWVVELMASKEWIGFTGMSVPGFEAAFTPAVEVGWRLVRSAWGRGYATEAADAALRVAFCELGLLEVVSFTTKANARSRAVMRRLGMRHDKAEDFAHPNLPSVHPLSSQVLYRLPRDSWLGRR